VVLGWIAVGTSVLAAGRLIRSRFRSDIDWEIADLREQLFFDFFAVVALFSSLGSIPRLFDFESDPIHWAFDLIALPLMIYAIVLGYRGLRLKEPSSL
jgi:hypothetical protein